MEIDLEFEGREKPVGRFSADMLCKELGTDRWVLIENQLEKTDHCHLGQPLTYAAGLQAVTIVWIAARFTEEHRAALDWLNQITDETVRFFGLEVELWRIGMSPAAPKFNIIAKPNDWSRSVAQAARSLEEGEPSEIKVLQQRYWAALNIVLHSRRGPVTGHNKPQLASFMKYSVLRSGLYLGAHLNGPKRTIRVQLTIPGLRAKAFFGLLKVQQAAIEGELGFPLDWQESPGKIESQVSRNLPNVDPDDETDWPRQHQWLSNGLNAMHTAFNQRVSNLDADLWQSDSG